VLFSAQTLTVALEVGSRQREVPKKKLSYVTRGSDLHVPVGSFHQLNIPRRQEEQQIFAILRTAHISSLSALNLILSQSIYLYINLSPETQSNYRGIRLLS
jgi:hypothetical protein